MVDRPICRGCLIPEGRTKHTAIYCDAGRTALEIFKITNLIVLNFTNNKCPAVLCQDCHLDLKKAMSFREMMIKNDRYFRTLFDEGIKSSLEDYYHEMKMYGSGNADELLGDTSSDSIDRSLKTETNVKEEEDRQTSDENHPKIQPLKLEDPSDSCESHEIHPKRTQIQNDSNPRKKIKIEHNSDESSDYTTMNEPSNTAETSSLHKVTNHDDIQSDIKLEEYETRSVNVVDSNPCESDILRQCSRNLEEITIENQSHQSSKLPTAKRHRSSDSESTDSSDSYLEHLTLKKHLTTDKTETTCRVCAKSFSKNLYLKQHLKSHMKLLHRCATCGKKFATSRELSEHITKHDRDKPFKCQHCQKSFNYKSDMNRHLLNHTANKPFKCDMCGKSFARSDHMAKHERTHRKKFFRGNEFD